MKHYGFGSRILAWVCVVVMLVMMVPLSGFTAAEEEIVEESPVFEAPVVLAALDGEGEGDDQSGDQTGDQTGDQSGEQSGDSGDAGGESMTQAYAVNWTDPENAAVTVTVDSVSITSGALVAEGAVVTIVAQAGEGYAIASVKMNDEALVADVNGDYQFIMPGNEVTVTVTVEALAYTVKISGGVDATLADGQTGKVVPGSDALCTYIISAPVHYTITGVEATYSDGTTLGDTDWSLEDTVFSVIGKNLRPLTGNNGEIIAVFSLSENPGYQAVLSEKSANVVLTADKYYTDSDTRGDYSFTIKAKEHYDLPESVEIMLGGNPVDNVIYDTETGNVTVPAGALADVAEDTELLVIADAVPEVYAVTVTLDGICPTEIKKNGTKLTEADAVSEANYTQTGSYVVSLLATVEDSLEFTFKTDTFVSMPSNLYVGTVSIDAGSTVEEYTYARSDKNIWGNRKTGTLTIQAGGITMDTKIGTEAQTLPGIGVSFIGDGRHENDSSTEYDQPVSIAADADLRAEQGQDYVLTISVAEHYDLKAENITVVCTYGDDTTQDVEVAFTYEGGTLTIAADDVNALFDEKEGAITITATATPTEYTLTIIVDRDNWLFKQFNNTSFEIEKPREAGLKFVGTDANGTSRTNDDTDTYTLLTNHWDKYSFTLTWKNIKSPLPVFINNESLEITTNNAYTYTRQGNNEAVFAIQGVTGEDSIVFYNSFNDSYDKGADDQNSGSANISVTNSIHGATTSVTSVEVKEKAETVTITFAAKGGYTLPESITVTVGGVELAASTTTTSTTTDAEGNETTTESTTTNWVWDAKTDIETGILTIYADAITDDITITGKCTLNNDNYQVVVGENTYTAAEWEGINGNDGACNNWYNQPVTFEAIEPATEITMEPNPVENHEGDVTFTLSDGTVKAAETTVSVKVDTTPPVVSVSTPDGRVHENGKYYTNDNISVVFTVDDTNFDGNYTIETNAEYSVAWSEDGKSCTVTLKTDDNKDGEYTVSFQATDIAGNVSDNNKEEDGAQYCTSAILVLDDTKPIVEGIKYEETDGKSSWINKLWWMIFGKPENANTEDRTVTGTITITDNLSPILEEDIVGKYIKNEKEVGLVFEPNSYTPNADATTVTIRFTADAQFKEEMIIYATDYAGNEGDPFVAEKDADGEIVSNPNLIVDTQAPVIQFFDGSEAVTPYYGTVHSTDYTVNVVVYEPGEEGKNSGLQSVTYEIKAYADKSVVAARRVLFAVETMEDGTLECAERMTKDVTISKDIHSNLVYVEVTAVDNAGNTKTWSTYDQDGQYLKMDDVDPVVSVVFDNNNALNSTYFDETRTATVTLIDNNFDPTNSDLWSFSTNGSVGSWSEAGISSNNEDNQNDIYELTIYYGPDDDYTLSMSAEDLGGNATSNENVSYTNQTAYDAFTVDRTAPTFEITMGNADVDVSSGGYSNQDVTVTLTVDEHNFDADAATAGLTVIYEGEDISQSIRNSLVWSSNGDVRTATFTLTDDGEYKINLSFLDLAGNSTAAAEDILVHVDQTNAEVYVTGVADKSANAQDEIIPVVTIWDKYYNLEGVVITLINGEGKDVTEQYLDMETGLSDIAYDEERDLYYQSFTFKNLDEDHVYHLEVRHTDLAGNVNTVMTVLNGKGEEEVLDLDEGVMRFSVNRNGSTYSASEETLAILGQYVQSAKNVRILEINVDELDPESIYITLTHDNVTRDLVYGEDYTYQTPPEQNDASWNVYEYVLEDSLFEEDGVYTITIYSVDAAGNVAQNNTEEKDFEITFVVDKTPPIFVALNLEAGEIYNEEQHEVTINCSDNIALDTVHVYRLDSTAEKDEDGNYIWFREKANGEIEMLCEEVELAAVEGSNGDYTFVIYEGDSAATSEQSVLVVCTDKAGNQNLEQEILDFTVSSSFWIRFYANKPLFYGSIGGISALLIVAAIVFLRKKKEEN